MTIRGAVTASIMGSTDVKSVGAGQAQRHELAVNHGSTDIKSVGALGEWMPQKTNGTRMRNTRTMYRHGCLYYRFSSVSGCRMAA